MAFDQFYQIGATSQIIEVPLRSSSTGQLLTGAAYGSITAKYVREGSNTQVTVSVVAASQGVYTSGGWIETGIAGVYQFGIPNAALAAGAKAVTLVFSASGAIDVVKRIVLVSEDLRDALISSRLAPVIAGRTLAVDADGVSNANMTHRGGVPVAPADGFGYDPANVLAWRNLEPASLNVAGEVQAVISGFSSQTVRDAMKLAPTAGDPAADSVDKHIDDLLEDTSETLPAEIQEAVDTLLNGLSGTTVTVVSSVDGGLVTVYVADTWRFTVASDQLALAGYETLGLIVKRNERQADSQALLYLRSDTGLARIGGAAPASAGNGTLTKTASSFTAVVHVAETQVLTPGGYTWWLKGLDTTPAPDEAVTLATGEFVVLAAGLQAVV
jgi:hypothetical protein